MDQGFAKLESMMSAVEERLRCLEKNDAGYQPLTTSRVDAAWRRLEEQQATISEHNKMLHAINLEIAGLKRTNVILSWLGGIMGSAVIIWLLGQILGLIK
ncbi:hypothetical protein SY88_23745 [Clostridiales bacterium PH28_bin88]|nr:hypothetical protein SY88_23745 [Clostridiales bacterium PH28_bin88]